MNKIMSVAMRAIEPMDCLDEKELENILKTKLALQTITVEKDGKKIKVNVWIQPVDEIFQTIHDWKEKAWMYDDCNK